MGTFAIIAMLLMYLFAAKQVTDTGAPRIAAMTHDYLSRNLVEGSKTSLMVMSRAGSEGPRRYELRLHPANRIAGDAEAVDRLLRRAAQMVHEEVGGARREAVVTCVAVLPEGELRVTYDRRMQKIPEAGAPEPAGDDA
jgi:hypothetical protein